MFKERTALVLGAGASAPFGYPLGSDLIDHIAQGLSNALKQERKDALRPSNIDVKKRPYSALVDYSDFCGGKPSRNELENIANYLKNTHHSSIDDVVRDNSSVGDTIKALIAIEILRHSFDPAPKGMNGLVPAASIFARSPANWYARLVSRLTDCSAPEQVYENKLSIITFNYDRSLEHYLLKQLPGSERFADIDPKKIVTPIHVHGELDFDGRNYEPFGKAFFDWVFTNAGKIGMVGDSSEQQTPQQHMIARRLLSDSERVFVLGFDFHESNVEAILLGRPEIVRKLIVLNWDGSERLRSRLGQLGVLSENIVEGARNSRLEIAQAIDDGLFDRR